MRKWFNSFGHALAGVLLFFKTERNARIELVFACIAILLSVWFQISLLEFCIILLCIAAVFSAEAFNSAIERLADVQSQRLDPRIKAIKDIAAGGVLMVAVVSVIIGIIIMLPKIL